MRSGRPGHRAQAGPVLSGLSELTPLKGLLGKLTELLGKLTELLGKLTELLGKPTELLGKVTELLEGGGRQSFLSFRPHQTL